jgi:hypothetical protein
LTIPDRVIGRREDNGDCFGRVLGRLNGQGSIGNEDIDFESNQLGSELRIPLRLSFGISVIKSDILSFNVAKLAETSLQSLNPACCIGRRSAYKNAYACDVLRLLRLN